jgi:hypothetical protein
MDPDSSNQHTHGRKSPGPPDAGSTTEGRAELLAALDGLIRRLRHNPRILFEKTWDFNEGLNGATINDLVAVLGRGPVFEYKSLPECRRVSVRHPDADQSAITWTTWSRGWEHYLEVANDTIAARDGRAKFTDTIEYLRCWRQAADLAPTSSKAPNASNSHTPFVPLTSWSEILAALNEPHGKVVHRNTDAEKAKIRKLNDEYDGPITFPKQRGKQPRVEKAKLMQWWNTLRERFEAREQAREQAAADAAGTTAETYRHGRSAEVVPEIDGHVKKTRKKR